MSTITYILLNVLIIIRASFFIKLPNFSIACGLTLRHISLYKNSGRYAHALYSAATKEGALSDVEGQLNALQSSINSVSGLKEYLSLPVCSKEEKKAAMGGKFWRDADENTFTAVVLIKSLNERCSILINAK